MEYLQVISAFEKPDFHVITSRWTMDKTLIIYIVDYVFWFVRSNKFDLKGGSYDLKTSFC